MYIHDYNYQDHILSREPGTPPTPKLYGILAVVFWWAVIVFMTMAPAVVVAAFLTLIVEPVFLLG